MAAYLDNLPDGAEQERTFLESQAPRLVLVVERLRRRSDSL